MKIACSKNYLVLKAFCSGNYEKGYNLIDVKALLWPGFFKLKNGRWQNIFWNSKKNIEKVGKILLWDVL